ncbi:unnamed protein product, partial [Coccothraustes coccothraustes]
PLPSWTGSKEHGSTWWMFMPLRSRLFCPARREQSADRQGLLGVHRLSEQVRQQGHCFPGTLVQHALHNAQKLDADSGLYSIHSL